MKTNNNSTKGIKWLKFGGLASQWAVALVGLIFFGKFLDTFFKLDKKVPIFIWGLPFLYILFSLYRVIKDTTSNSK